jgi:predicted nucleotidyltransferase
MMTENDISRAATLIVKGYGPMAVGTFGSYATGRARESSDLDLFVIKQTPASSQARRRAVRRLLHGFLNPIDVHVFLPEEFEEAAREEHSFEWVIARQARLYYWNEQAKHRVPSIFGASNGVWSGGTQ